MCATASTISGCFNHCGFIAPSISTDKNNTDEDIQDSTIIEQICTRYYVNFINYLSADDELKTNEPLTDDAIRSIVQRLDDSDTESDDEFMPPFFVSKRYVSSVTTLPQIAN